MNRTSKLKEIPTEESVLRFIFKEHWRIDDTGKVFVLPNALFPRVKRNETALSVTWIDFFEGSKEKKLHLAAKTLSESLRMGSRDKKPLKPNSLFAIFKVGEIKAICSKYGVSAKICHTESKSNEAHATITFYESGKNLYENLNFNNLNDKINVTEMNEAILGERGVKLMTLENINYEYESTI